MKLLMSLLLEIKGSLNQKHQRHCKIHASNASDNQKDFWNKYSILSRINNCTTFLKGTENLDLKHALW